MARRNRTLTVRARQGVRFPEEGRPRRYISDTAPQTVPASAYYRKAIRDGDLEVVDAPLPGPTRARPARAVSAPSTPVPADQE